MVSKKSTEKKLTKKQIEKSGPIDLPTPTLLLLGVLLTIVAVTMLIYPGYWFTPIFKLESGCKTNGDIEKVWLSKPITQCAEAWHEENIPLENYFATKGLTVYEMKYGKTEGVGDIVCQACHCPSGHDLLILVNEEDKDKFEGFEIFAED